VAGNPPAGFEENTMDTPDTKNASLLFSTIRRRRSHEVLVAGALIFASYFAVATVLIDNYQRPDVAAATARV
jgi:hypothetical protein